MPTALNAVETWNMGAAERKRLNVEELRHLRSMCGVIMNQVRNEEMRRRTAVVRELVDREEQGVLQWFGHTDRKKGIW